MTTRVPLLYLSDLQRLKLFVYAVPIQKVYTIKTTIDRNRTHFSAKRREIRKYGTKKRLSLVRTEPKGQKLKISELICN